MGAEYLYTCGNCGFNITTSGPWEFIRNNTGGYITCYDAGEIGTNGIDGLSGSVYCSRCNRVYDMILAEFEHPAHTDFYIWWLWSDPGNNFLRQHNVKCTVCGNTGLIMEPDEQVQIDCPACNHGVLQGKIKSIL